MQEQHILKPRAVANGIPVYCAFDELADADLLVPNPRNPNRHPESQIALLAKIIKAQGWRAPITVSVESGFIVRGHGRLLAARKLGVRQVPVDRQHYATEADEWADLIADNRLAELAEMDDGLLHDLLKDFEGQGYDLDLTGFVGEDLEEILAAFPEQDDRTVVREIEPPERPKKPITKRGDLWQLGPHRILCGDSTAVAHVERLLAGRRVDQLVTDPPYGVDYSAKNEFLNKFDKGNRVQTPIANDAIGDYRAFFGSFLSIIPFSDYNTLYIFMSGKELHSLRLALDDCGLQWGDYLVWVKNNHVLGRKDYNAKHEFIVYGWKGKHKFYGGFSTTVLEYDRPAKSDLHPTMKPVALVSRLITDGSAPGALVYDPFLGSGTTLIAAEQLGRVCYAMEIDPGYVDVTVARWEELTGKKATRQAAT